MQTTPVTPNNNNIGVKTASKSCLFAIGRQQSEIALLLEEAQEQLRALAHRKQEENTVVLEPQETVCFLNLNAGGGASVGCDPPTHTQLLSLCRSHRDLVHSDQ